jgi:hypothetical protein
VDLRDGRRIDRVPLFKKEHLEHGPEIVDFGPVL